VKELRLAGAATLAEGNALLPAFMADYNARFAKPPANNKDLHRSLCAGVYRVEPTTTTDTSRPFSRRIQRQVRKPRGRACVAISLRR
jgi:hypothetical protein